MWCDCSGHGRSGHRVVIVIDVAMVVEWWCRGRVRRASRAGGGHLLSSSSWLGPSRQLPGRSTMTW